MRNRPTKNAGTAAGVKRIFVAIGSIKLANQAAYRLLGITKQHSRIVFVEQWIFNAGKA